MNGFPDHAIKTIWFHHRDGFVNARQTQKEVDFIANLFIEINKRVFTRNLQCSIQVHDYQLDVFVSRPQITNPLLKS